MNVVSRRHPAIGDYVCKEKRALSDRSLPYPTRRTAPVFFGSPMPFPDGREMKFFAVLRTLRYVIAALDVLADRTGPGIANRNFFAEQTFSITCTKAAHLCAALLF